MPPAGHSSLRRQRRVTRRKATPSPRRPIAKRKSAMARSPPLLACGGVRIQAGSGRHKLRCSALPRDPTSKAHGNVKSQAALLPDSGAGGKCAGGHRPPYECRKLATLLTWLLIFSPVVCAEHRKDGAAFAGACVRAGRGRMPKRLATGQGWPVARPRSGCGAQGTEQSRFCFS